jgi:membrane associated rhomboid family serine protease
MEIFHIGDAMVCQWEVNYFVLMAPTNFLIHVYTRHSSFAGKCFSSYFGLRGEEMFSLPEFLSIYLVGGLVGNVLSLVFGPYFISVGASGAIFSLFGACVIYDRRSMRQSILGALVYAFFLFFINTGEGVNILAHLGGLAFGLFVGYIIASKRKPQNEPTQFKYKTSPF